jgi:hypothetical protein
VDRVGTATASDERSSISRVEFYVGTSLVGSDTTAPYSYNYNTRTQPNVTKAITAKAYDSVNNVGTSAAVNVTFDNDFIAPTVVLTAPTDGATLTGTVTFSVDASDDRSGISKVDFYIGTSLVGTSTTAPYSYSYNSRLQSNGVKTVSARASDTAGNTSSTAAVSVTFSNDFTAPTAAVTSPASGSTVSGVVQVTCAASDNWGVISKVDFYRSSTLIGTTAAEPFSMSWDTATVPTGTSQLRCRAFDPAGNSAYSPFISVTVTR